jgi:hypothetical protein
MADMHRLSEQIIDFGERLADVSDAARGDGRTRRSGLTRWVLLPAAGAGLYALAKSEFFSKKAQGVVDEAKTRATELPNDLMKTVRQTNQQSSSASGGGTRRRTTGSARKAKASR